MPRRIGRASIPVQVVAGTLCRKNIEAKDSMKADLIYIITIAIINNICDRIFLLTGKDGSYPNATSLKDSQGRGG